MISKLTLSPSAPPFFSLLNLSFLFLFSSFFFLCELFILRWSEGSYSAIHILHFKGQRGFTGSSGWGVGKKLGDYTRKKKTHIPISICLTCKNHTIKRESARAREREREREREKNIPTLQQHFPSKPPLAPKKKRKKKGWKVNQKASQCVCFRGAAPPIRVRCPRDEKTFVSRSARESLLFEGGQENLGWRANRGPGSMREGTNKQEGDDLQEWSCLLGPLLFLSLCLSLSAFLFSISSFVTGLQCVLLFSLPSFFLSLSLLSRERSHTPDGFGKGVQGVFGTRRREIDAFTNWISIR